MKNRIIRLSIYVAIGTALSGIITFAIYHNVRIVDVFYPIATFITMALLLPVLVAGIFDYIING